MRYTADEFMALQDDVNAQGGALLPDICAQSDVKFTKPPYKRAHTEKRITCGCGELCRFVSVYDNGKDGEGFVTACAVCDSMGAWPRYAIAVNGANDPEDDDE